MSRWGSIAKRILIALAVGAGVIVLLGAGLVAYFCTDKQDTFALNNAEFADLGYLGRLQSRAGNKESRPSNALSVYAHRLKRGTGIVFGFREYSPGRLGIIDDETYRKITVWMAGTLPTSRIEARLGDDARLRIIMSEGGSAWPRSGCSRVATAGTVRVQPTHNRFMIAISAETAPAGDPASDQCGPKRIDLSFEAKKTAFDDLTPWLGREGHHPYDETYR